MAASYPSITPCPSSPPRPRTSKRCCGSGSRREPRRAGRRPARVLGLGLLPTTPSAACSRSRWRRRRAALCCTAVTCAPRATTPPVARGSFAPQTAPTALTKSTTSTRSSFQTSSCCCPTRTRCCRRPIGVRSRCPKHSLRLARSCSCSLCSARRRLRPCQPSCGRRFRRRSRCSSTTRPSPGGRCPQASSCGWRTRPPRTPPHTSAATTRRISTTRPPWRRSCRPPRSLPSPPLPRARTAARRRRRRCCTRAPSRGITRSRRPTACCPLHTCSTRRDARACAGTSWPAPTTGTAAWRRRH
mmetsp:Transcript_2032/g.5412  ORF Transcript_2032/g.5412 Transcript_2032/m.5412 type:complete len:301 (-) Transcript_2032:145-1047(-)